MGCERAMWAPQKHVVERRSIQCLLQTSTVSLKQRPFGDVFPGHFDRIPELEGRIPAVLAALSSAILTDTTLQKDSRQHDAPKSPLTGGFLSPRQYLSVIKIRSFRPNLMFNHPVKPVNEQYRHALVRAKDLICPVAGKFV